MLLESPNHHVTSLIVWLENRSCRLRQTETIDSNEKHTMRRLMFGIGFIMLSIQVEDGVRTARTVGEYRVVAIALRRSFWLEVHLVDCARSHFSEVPVEYLFK
jgi:hypothetical protein